MAYEFKGNQRCSRCGKDYEWCHTEMEGIAITGSMRNLWHNVRNCTQVNRSNQYVLELGCPFCGKNEHITCSRPE